MIENIRSELTCNIFVEYSIEQDMPTLLRHLNIARLKWVHVERLLTLFIVFYQSLFVSLIFFIWPYNYLSFVDLRSLITVFGISKLFNVVWGLLDKIQITFLSIYHMIIYVDRKKVMLCYKQTMVCKRQLYSHTFSRVYDSSWNCPLHFINNSTYI